MPSIFYMYILCSHNYDRSQSAVNSQDGFLTAGQQYHKTTVALSVVVNAVILLCLLTDSRTKQWPGNEANFDC